MSISVLVVDDEPEFLRRFSDAVLSDPELQLAGAVATGAAARALLAATAPDVTLVDLGLPDVPGIELIRETTARRPDADMLVITVFGDDAHVLASIEAGATGYLLKDTSVARIVAAIKEVHAGGSPISPSIARRVLARCRVGTAAPAAGAAASAAPTASRGADPDAPVLSQRETDILRFVAKGLAFAEIGAHLEISPHTVVSHVKKIYRKLAVHSRGEAVYEAGQMGLL